MQYISTCLQCDHYLATPQTSHAQRETMDHSEDTGHVVHYKGRYDSPTGSGLYQDGSKLDLSPEEKMERIRRFNWERQ